MKYVLFNNEDYVIIPESQSHDQFKHFNPISAGFCKMETYRNEWDDIKIKVYCYGESISLGIKSRGKVDEEIIAMRFR